MNDRGVLVELSPTGVLLLCAGDAQHLAAAIAAWRREALIVRSLRGRKMRTVSALFDEVAAALQFPGYFGENGPAFNECLSDLDWLDAGAGLVLVWSEPGEVLVDSDDADLGALVRATARAGATYAQPIDLGEWWDRPAIPFHVVLWVSPDDVERVTTRWAAAGAAIETFSP